MTRDEDTIRRMVPISPAEAHAQEGRVAELVGAIEHAAQVFEMLHSGLGLTEQDERAVFELCSQGLKRIAETKGEAATDEAFSIWQATDTKILATVDRHVPGEDAA